MNRHHKILGPESGLTFIEVLVTVVVLAILTSILQASYETLRARIRGSQVRTEMDSVALAAYEDYASNLGVWAAMSCDAMPIEWTTDPVLNHWPTAPCPSWYYCWEDFSVFGNNISRVTLRNARDGVVWSYCVNTFGGGVCQPVDPITGVIPPEISVNPARYIYCSEGM
jgi:prepilin-type N-terminal cleavage/methylation domain-containing protein